MIGLELCPHCGSKQYTEQPSSNRQSQVIFYECGNSITFNFGKYGELISNEDHGECENKVDWTNVLVPYNEEFDNNAKSVDDRFFGWIELQFYQNYHGVGWSNKYFGRNCNESEFLDKYFNNKELYLRSVRDDNENIIYIQPVQQTVVKDYSDWIGSVSMQEVYKSVKDYNETVVYRVISSEDDQSLIGGYVVERNPIGGGDQGRSFYDRNILDIIIERERK
jgi:hypothetical protein